MSTTFNDANAWLNGQGNLSLGNAGKDDASGDANALYAKSDVFIVVPLWQLTSLTQALTFARTSAGIYTTALAAAASTGVVVVPFNPPHRKFTNTPGGPQNPHGFKILDLMFGYTIATASETSIAVTFNVEVQTNATARALVSNPFGSGAVTYQNPPGTTVANPPVAAQATPYVVKAVPATPAFITSDGAVINAEISFVNPGTSVATLTFVAWHCSMALY